jgi:glucose-6-phosphate 1-dehydrogenase
MKVKENQILIIFGASGDLTRRKLMPALYHLFRNGLLSDKFAIIGVGRTQMDDHGFRLKMGEALKRMETESKNSSLDEFISDLHYVSIDTNDIADYKKLKLKIINVEQHLNIESNYVFYLATPPSLYEIIAKGIFKQNLNRENKGWTRLVVEKPFGNSLESARKLNDRLLKYFREEQIYRIDHYLGKESVQNIMVTRFSNGLFEPLWNRNYIRHIEITSAEDIGVENRGGYYDNAGALRDMVQNHILQLVTLVAMEPPTLINSLAIRNETLKVLQSLRPIKKEDVSKFVIRGQYLESTVRGSKIKSYRDEPEIAPDSRTETFVALKLFIDNWRWGGVPFYIRTGKRLPTRVTEIVIHFKPTPHRLFVFDEGRFNSENQLILRIQPDEGILLKFGMKIPGVGFNVQEVNMDFHYSDLGNQEIPEAYQRLLLDCCHGDSTLYTRGDAAEEAWKLIDPIIQAWNENPEIQIYGYPAGTWGPDVSDSLLEGENTTWRYPCKNLTNDGTYCEL